MPLEPWSARAKLTSAAGLAVRVPLTNSSLTDAVFEVARDTTAEEVNQLLTEASETYLKNILRVRFCPCCLGNAPPSPPMRVATYPSSCASWHVAA